MNSVLDLCLFRSYWLGFKMTLAGVFKFVIDARLLGLPFDLAMLTVTAEGLVIIFCSSWECLRKKQEALLMVEI